MHSSCTELCYKKREEGQFRPRGSERMLLPCGEVKGKEKGKKGDVILPEPNLYFLGKRV